MKILIINRYVPYPPTTGGALRIFNLLQHISRHHDVSLVSLYDPLSGEGDGAAYLKTLCTRVELVAKRRRPKREHLPRLLRGTLRGEPMRNVFIHFEEMADKIRTLTADERFDIVQIHHSSMAPYIDAISPASHCHSARALFD